MNYYQQENPAINISPYQQNIDIIKNFFRKPIVLVNTIFETIAIPVLIFMFFTMANYVNSTFQKLYYDMYSYYGNSFPSDPSFFANFLSNFILVIGITACIPGVITIIAKFLIYFKSKNSDPNVKPSAGFTILWVLSIIVICLLGMLCFFFIISMIMAIFVSASSSTLYYYNSYSSQYSGTATVFAYVAMLIIYSIIFAIAFFYLINQIRFYGSVRKSLNSIYLKRNGAMISGVFRIIGGSFNCFGFIMYVFSLITTAFLSAATGATDIPIDFLALMTLLMGLNGATGITGGIIAVKYAGYIRNIVFGTNQQFNANVPYSNPVPVNPFDNAYSQPQPIQNNPYGDMQNENPYANPVYPQQVNPQAPAEPVPASDNPYYQPVENPAPQDNIPQQESNSDNSFCPNCGSHVFRSDMFCNNCGAKLK